MLFANQSFQLLFYEAIFILLISIVFYFLIKKRIICRSKPADGYLKLIKWLVIFSLVIIIIGVIIIVVNPRQNGEISKNSKGFEQVAIKKDTLCNYYHLSFLIPARSIINVYQNDSNDMHGFIFNYESGSGNLIVNIHRLQLKEDMELSKFAKGIETFLTLKSKNEFYFDSISKFHTDSLNAILNDYKVKMGLLKYIYGTYICIKDSLDASVYTYDIQREGNFDYEEIEKIVKSIKLNTY